MLYNDYVNISNDFLSKLCKYIQRNKNKMLTKFIVLLIEVYNLYNIFLNTIQNFIYILQGI
jgi:hypothetical protein